MVCRTTIVTRSPRCRRFLRSSDVSGHRASQRILGDTSESSRSRLGVVSESSRSRLGDTSESSRRQLAALPPRSPDEPPALASSPDGRWIAVGFTLVAAAGGAVCRPFEGATFDLQWRPHTDTLIASSGSGSVLIGGPGMKPHALLPPGFGAGRAAFDPAGRRLVPDARSSPARRRAFG
jgi:hypothetical protein